MPAKILKFGALNKEGINGVVTIAVLQFFVYQVSFNFDRA